MDNLYYYYYNMDNQNIKNRLLLEFWTIYDTYGITSALEWLEYNKYYDNISINDINNIDNLLNKLNINST